MARYGRYMACFNCGNAIKNESKAFTDGFGNSQCQKCGLVEILTPSEWYAIFQIQSGENVVAVRKQCSTLRTYPPNNGVSVVEFASTDGSKLCIIRDGQDSEFKA